MTERRYSEEEVSAIFELATKAQAGSPRQLRSGEGMTLAGLQEIGREVGIPPDLVAQAAHSLVGQGGDTTKRLLGLPIGVGKTVDLGRKLSDDEWEQLVVECRMTFDATGHVKEDGAFRQWSNGKLQILAEPTATGGHQLRMKTVRSTSLGYFAIGGTMLGVGAASALILTISGQVSQGKPLRGVLFMAVIGVGALVWGSVALPGWARLRRGQFNALAERLQSSTKG